LDVQKLSQDCTLGENAFRQLNEPVVVQGQRASALRFADVQVQALFCALVVFRLLPRGFCNRELRDHWAPLLGKKPAELTAGQMTYHLRRLRLHGLIERIPKTHRYRVTQEGFRIALFCTRTYTRVLRPGLAHCLDQTDDNNALQKSFLRLERALQQEIDMQTTAA
jgi:hypothetical protein